MAKIILAINAGSSSLKISVFGAEKEQLPKQLAEIQISGLTAPPAKLKYVRGSERVAKDQKIEQEIKSQDEAFNLMLQWLIDDEKFPQLSSEEDVSHICHRVVHGGDYTSPKIMTSSILHQLDALSTLAPLHNGPALSILRACLNRLPSSTTNIAFFDTLFHATLPPHIYTYAIDQDVARAKGLRKYGFHGISYAFITHYVAAFLGEKESETSLIACHLGSGASVCAIKNGKSVDTSMGLTPLDGLPGATRSGSVDPSLIFHYASHVSRTTSNPPNSSSDSSQPHNLQLTQAESILNKSAGWASLTGTTDFSSIVSSACSPSSANTIPNASLAFDLFTSRILSYIGSYYLTLNGHIDALVFAGGIGEGSHELRQRVVQECACLGFGIDEAANSGKKASAKTGNEAQTEEGKGNPRDEESVVWDISGADSKYKVLVCRTDEQAEMARACVVNGDLGLFNDK